MISRLQYTCDGKKTMTRITYTVSVVRRPAQPCIISLVAKGHGAVQQAQFNVED